MKTKDYIFSVIVLILVSIIVFRLNVKINPNVLIAVITVIGSTLAAGLSYYFTKSHEIAMKWREEKISHYRKLLTSITELGWANSGIPGITDEKEANKKFSLAYNTIGLVAPEYVINALNAFMDEISVKNTNKTKEKHDQLLKELILAIREDIKILPKGNIDTFKFNLKGFVKKEDKK